MQCNYFTYCSRNSSLIASIIAILNFSTVNIEFSIPPISNPRMRNIHTNISCNRKSWRNQSFSCKICCKQIGSHIWSPTTEAVTHAVYFSSNNWNLYCIISQIKYYCINSRASYRQITTIRGDWNAIGIKWCNLSKAYIRRCPVSIWNFKSLTTCQMKNFPIKTLLPHSWSGWRM